MPYAPFDELFPEVAKLESRMIQALPGNPDNLPPGMYHLLEVYCDEPGCDCQRVILHVASSQTNQIEATIHYGWESQSFYAKWFGGDDEEIAREMQGPDLNRLSPQSNQAEAILAMVKAAALSDSQYVEILKRHYAMFRAKIEEQARHGELPQMPVPGTDLQLQKPETLPTSGRIEEQRQDVLQNIEWMVIDFYHSHRSISDFTVLQVYEALARSYGAEAKGQAVRPIEMSGPEAELLERVRTICEWRLGRGSLSESDDSPGDKIDSQYQIDVPTLVRCLKRLVKSVQKNTRDGGRQGYLNFVSEFV